MKSVFGTAILSVYLSIGSVAWACNPTEAEVGMIWCKAQCSVPHSQPQCDASGRMDNYAKNRDALGIRNAFGDCQSGNDDDKIKQRANVEQCFLHNQPALIQAACNVYGCSSPTPTPSPTPPPPLFKKIDFNQPMKPATDNKQIVVADFKLSGQGEYSSITLAFTRDNQSIFSLSTYAVNFDHDGGMLHIKITTYDKSVPDVSRHKYSVAGTLEVRVP